MAYILLTNDIIDPERAISRVTTPAHGAVVTFLGNVRDNSRGVRVSYLEYEGYRPMAEKALANIIEAAERQWDVHCAIEHRLGRVNVGETSVVIAVSSPHRVDAFEACRWLMDTLKETVPIWKKEFVEAGAHWVEGSEIVESPDRGIA